MTDARSTAEKGASGGLTRDKLGSPWIWASSAFTPGTKGLPSNSLRIVTAASSAVVSPSLQARAQRSALRLAVAEMHPAKSPRREQAGFGRREDCKALRDGRGRAGIGHVARGILQSGDAGGE